MIRIAKKSLLIAKPILLTILISCGSDMYDAANREKSLSEPETTPEILEPAEIYTNATLTDVKAQEDNMTLGDTVVIGPCSYYDVFIDFSNSFATYPANSMAFYYKTSLGNYGKMIITNEMKYDSSANLPYPPIVLSFVTYDPSGNIIASGTNVQVLQNRTANLDDDLLNSASGYDQDFFWYIDNSYIRIVQSDNNAKFYRID